MQPISQHELSYLVKGLRTLDEFDITVTLDVEISSI
ncbi:hypothetical protein BH18THE1_BH18THE1_00580 [soil metagenome]